MRPSAMLLALSTVLIAGSVGVVAHWGLGATGTEAFVAACAAYVALSVHHYLVARWRENERVGLQLRSLAAHVSDLQRQTTEHGRRLASLDTEIGGVGEDTRIELEPIQAELDMMGGLVKQLAESVAAHEMALVRSMAAPGYAPSPGYAAAAPVYPPAPAYAPQAYEAVAEPTVHTAAAAPATPAIVAAPQAAAQPTPAQHLRQTIAEMIRAGRVDLHVQPVVDLPQRKMRHLEALARLPLGDGQWLTAADFLPEAEAAGLLPLLDRFAIEGALTLAGRLAAKNREGSIFCNVSALTLADPAFSAIVAALDANRALAGRIMVEFGHADYLGFGALDREAMATLAELGVRFSLDSLAHVRLDARQLAEDRFRFVKVPAAMLLDSGHHAQADIDPADLSDLLGRAGIALIAERVETEAELRDVLEYQPKFGQGFLFGQPKPLRLDGAAAPMAPVAAAMSLAVPAQAAPAPAARAAEPRPAPQPAPVPAPAVQEDTPTALLQIARGLMQRSGGVTKAG